MNKTYYVLQGMILTAIRVDKTGLIFVFRLAVH